MKTLALIGVGKWGRNIVSALETIKEANLKYLCTRTAASLTSYAPKYERVSDWRELLKKKDLDAVLIATPPSTHASIAVPFLKRKVPVFVEKPMTTSLAEAEIMAAEALKEHTPVFVGHIHLYNPAYLAAKKAIRACGVIKSIHTVAGNNGPFRDDFSVLWDWAPHDVAVILDLVGEEPKSVQGWGISILRPQTELYDIAFIKLLFSSGLVATIRVSWLDPVKHKKVSVTAGESIITFDDALPEKKVTVFKNMLPEPDLSKKTLSLKRREPEVSYPSYGSERPLTEELKSFLDCVSNKTKPLTDVAQGLSVTRILDAAERSMKEEGREIILAA